MVALALTLGLLLSKRTPPKDSLEFTVLSPPVAVAKAMEFEVSNESAESHTEFTSRSYRADVQIKNLGSRSISFLSGVYDLEIQKAGVAEWQMISQMSLSIVQMPVGPHEVLKLPVGIPVGTVKWRLRTSFRHWHLGAHLFDKLADAMHISVRLEDTKEYEAISETWDIPPEALQSEKR